MTTKCIDCGKNKAPAWEIGSWQCEECQMELFNRLRTDYGIYPKNYEYLKNKERVEELLEAGLKGYQISEEADIDQKVVYKIIKDIKEREKEDMSLQTVGKLMDDGLKAKDIAEKTGLAVGTVYQYMSKVRGKNEVNGVTENKPKAKTQEKQKDVALDKLQEENKRLKERIETLKEVNGKAGDQIEGLKSKLKKMTNQQQEIDTLTTENNGLIKELKLTNDALERMREENSELKATVHNMTEKSDSKEVTYQAHVPEDNRSDERMNELLTRISLAEERANNFQDSYNEVLSEIVLEKRKKDALLEFLSLEHGKQIWG